MQVRSFDAQSFALRAIAQDIFGVKRLEDLHHLLGGVTLNCVEFKNDQSTLFHKIFYANQRHEFIQEFTRFIVSEIRPLFNERILYQAIPTFRCHLPRNLSVGAFHKDADYNHSTSEINFFLPLTDAFDTNTIWAESAPGLADYKPFPRLTYGQFVQWDGANLMHGNKLNETDITRVSVDFRVLPYSKYDEASAGARQTIHVHKKMIAGDYFKIV